MDKSSIRVLVVDDYEPWHDFISKKLREQPELQIIGHASDGSQAVQQAQQLQPDLILLDIGLPKLNGIEAARQIRLLSPQSKVLFLSEDRSPDIMEAALTTGAAAYVVKSDAAGVLLRAIKAVLDGKRFVSTMLTVKGSSLSPSECSTTISHRHEVAFYEDETSLVGGYAQCVESALQNGNAVIVVVTESHRGSLVGKLTASGLDVASAIEQGTLTLVDASDALSSLIVDGMPEPMRCSQLVGDLMKRAATGIKEKHGRVVFCGGIAPILLSNGNAEAAIQLEHLWDEITRGYDVHTLCGYVRSASERVESSPILKRICAEHSSVHNVRH